MKFVFEKEFSFDFEDFVEGVGLRFNNCIDLTWLYKEVKNGTKQQGYLWNGFKSSTDDTLYDCYGRVGYTKAAIEHYIRLFMYRLGGNDFRIVSHSRWTFSCAFVDKDGNLWFFSKNHVYKVPPIVEE